MKKIEILFVDMNEEQKEKIYNLLDKLNRPFKVKGKDSKRRIIFKSSAEERWVELTSVGVQWWQK